MDTALIDTALRNDELNERCCGQVRVICTSPDNLLLLAIDADGRCLVINKKRRALLHRFSFKGPVGAARFSPDGRFIACAVGKVLQVPNAPQEAVKLPFPALEPQDVACADSKIIHHCGMGARWLQVWRAPGFVKLFAPMQLYRTYGGCTADITSVDWTEDSFWITVASKDLTARCVLMATSHQQIPAIWLATDRLMHESCCRVFSLNPVEGYRAPTLAGHKDNLVAAFFAGKPALAIILFAIDPRFWSAASFWDAAPCHVW